MNDLGIFFMTGNLSEWVLDWYDPDFYKHSPLENPVNSDNPVTVKVGIRDRIEGYAKVHRGGNEFHDNSLGQVNNVFQRFYREPEHYSFGSVGIRCAINTAKAL
jgi:formylglycine-generating enzyme required for sulfatase activity